MNQPTDVRVPIDADDLWGNLAGDDEDIEVLDSYFVDKPDLFSGFRDRRVPLRIVAGRKGMGKSALLRKVAHEKSLKDAAESLVIEASGPDLGAGFPDSDETDELIFWWKSKLSRRILVAIGAELDLAIREDEIVAVEQAQLEGRRPGSLYKILLDHFEMSVNLGGVANVKAKESGSTGDLQSRVQRLQGGAGKRQIWMFVDDIDATYQGTPRQRLKISTFLSACRLLANSVEGLCVRIAIRSDVWADVQATDEALDKVAQYVIELRWNEEETRQILAERIRGWVRRQRRTLPMEAMQTNYNGDRHALRYVFADPWKSNQDVMRGSSGRPPHVWIHELSYGRPRWSARLCKLASAAAVTGKATRIEWKHLSSILQEFGEKRVIDLVREHRHQCPEVEELIQAFVDQAPTMTTAELMVTITNRILNHLSPTIDGDKVQSPVTVGHFLFRIGFLVAVWPNGPDFETRNLFEARPTLLKTRTNMDEGARWEIHHCFRKFLRMPDG